MAPCCAIERIIVAALAALASSGLAKSKRALAELREKGLAD
jgi:hypothetical protein